MPELPEVEYARRCLERWLDHAILTKVTAVPGKPLRGTTPDEVAALTGRRLEKVERQGKHLMLTFGGGAGMHLHLGMTGKLLRRAPGDPPQRFERARFETGKTAVVFADSRRFGRLELVPAGELCQLPDVADLGPDALDAPLDGKALATRLGRTRRPLKIALMDQSLVAGLGNIQAAEALFRAKLSPFLPPQKLDAKQWRDLAKGIRDSLAYSLREESPGEGKDIEYVEEPGTKNPFLVYGRAGEPCRRCGTKIKSDTQGQRTTYYCPKCQNVRR